MNERESKWSSGRKLVAVLIVAVVGAIGWAIAQVALGPESMSQGVELEPDQWSLVDQGERSVTIRFEEGGGCHGFKESEVEEPDGEVRVSMVVEYFVPGEGAACTDVLKSRSVEVGLERDLGNRKLRVFRKEVRR